MPALLVLLLLVRVSVVFVAKEGLLAMYFSIDVGTGSVYLDRFSEIGKDSAFDSCG